MKCPGSATEEDDDVQDDHERKGVECCTRERRAARRARAARAAPAPRRAGCSRRTTFFFMSSATELLLRVLAGRSAARSRAVGGVGVRGVRGGQRRSAASAESRQRSAGGSWSVGGGGRKCEKFGVWCGCFKPCGAGLSTLPRCAPVIAYLVIKRRAKGARCLVGVCGTLEVRYGPASALPHSLPLPLHCKAECPIAFCRFGPFKDTLG